jgi:hypothetical protein
LDRYERRNIHLWLQQHDVSPLTNQVLGHKILNPNLLARTLSDNWRERHGLPIPPPPVFDHGEKVSGGGGGAAGRFERDATVLAAFARANLKMKFEMLDDTAAHLKSEFAAILQRGDVCLNQFTVDALAGSASKTHQLSLTIVEFAEQFGVQGVVVPMDDDFNVGLQLPVCNAPASLLQLQDMTARIEKAVQGYKRVWEGMMELNQARGGRMLLSLMQNLLLVRANAARARKILEDPNDCKVQLLQLVTDIAQNALHMKHLGADVSIVCFPPKLRPLRESRILSTVPRSTQDDFFQGVAVT